MICRWRCPIGRIAAIDAVEPPLALWPSQVKAAALLRAEPDDPFAGRRDMLSHQLGRPLPVTPPERLDDSPMLLDRLFRTTGNHP